FPDAFLASYRLVQSARPACLASAARGQGATQPPAPVIVPYASILYIHPTRHTSPLMKQSTTSDQPQSLQRSLSQRSIFLDQSAAVQTHSPCYTQRTVCMHAFPSLWEIVLCSLASITHYSQTGTGCIYTC